MSKVINFEHPRKLRAEVHGRACAWLVRLESGLSAEEQQELSAWVAADSRHTKAFLEMAALWDRMDVLSELSQLFPPEQYLAGLHSTARPKGPRALKAVAAVLAVVVTGAVLVGVHRMPSGGYFAPLFREALVEQAYETAVGDQQSVDLPDGSRVLLNTNTSIGVRYSDDARRVRLERGEAHFTVVENIARPFEVHANGRIVRAVGTAFSVRSGPDNLEVVVTDGRVDLRLDSVATYAMVPTAEGEQPEQAAVSADATISLLAGDRATVNRQARSVSKERMQPQAIEIRLAWRHGMLLFQGDRLEDVLHEVSRYTTTTIEAHPSIRDLRVTGYFRAGDLEALQVAMRENFGIVTRRIQADHVYLAPQ